VVIEGLRGWRVALTAEAFFASSITDRAAAEAKLAAVFAAANAARGVPGLEGVVG
jgi:hypothetical protein